MPTVPAIHRRGTRLEQPAANTVTIGTLYFVTDEFRTERSDGAIWESYSGVGAGGGVNGPVGAVHLDIAVFDGTTGQYLKDSGTTIAALLSLISDLQTQINDLEARVTTLEAP